MRQTKKHLAVRAAGLGLTLALFCSGSAAALSEFTDVPSRHWAHDAISAMASRGVIAGVGGNLYAPESTVTNAQFIAMIGREFYGTQDSAVDVWYAPHLAALAQDGRLAGTQIGANNSLADAIINRYDMAQIMYNIVYEGEEASTVEPSEPAGDVPAPEETTGNITAETDGDQDDALVPPEGSKPEVPPIADWNTIPEAYQTAVSTCYEMGLLSGVDTAGTFYGEGSMSRAQAATAVNRLIYAKTGLYPPLVPAQDRVSQINLFLADLQDHAANYLWVRSDKVTPIAMWETKLNSSFPRRGGNASSGADHVFGWGALHNGNDFITDVRDVEPCWQVALWKGTVAQAGYQTGYGWTVLLDHGHGFYTRYAHMGFGRAASSGGYPRWWDAVVQKEMGGVASSLLVSEGDEVEAGQILGLMGTTGNSSGPHAHIEMILSPGGYEYIAWRAGVANILMDCKPLSDLTWYYGCKNGYGQSANIYDILGAEEVW